MSEHNHVVSKDGNVSMGRVGDVLERIEPQQREQILDNFGEFQQYLSKRIHLAQKIGMGEEQLAVAAEKVADYLANHEEPRNSEQKLLQELWKVGNKEERHRLAHMLVKLARR
ncbi:MULTISPECIES: DUF3243 domain-containing protein [unclassified Paenibacillus]|uniref:DUF3243 domain-containing protein n=1 Tax=unclassified Paenibacillus TaxID=185978 RepID=UPI00076DB64E|nr:MULTISPECIES: DUF3243 domain-containing protein [unclassified Paenibacillus]KUP21495.1 hypothetical protein AWJ19_32940 [Paenibacillus sp. DMB5]MDF9840046.1 hypothetical protein [Paenibacillus sp. PastF-2]MDF9846628.1 hypothetical protein [Paenibacillus sp. PastM-2]MDF9853024.1 hypothetical protein [Paenibacillus sp. PastF-1]MDH6478472.1 hypothetical protein [Paenibacillus sp. PastH-2]